MSNDILAENLKYRCVLLYASLQHFRFSIVFCLVLCFMYYYILFFHTHFCKRQPFQVGNLHFPPTNAQLSNDNPRRKTNNQTTSPWYCSRPSPCLLSTYPGVNLTSSLSLWLSCHYPALAMQAVKLTMKRHGDVQHREID